MKSLKKPILLLLVLAMVLTMIAGCKGNSDTDETGGAGENGGYTVNLKTQGGMAMSGIDVYVYADDSLTDMKDFGQTDKNGSISFDLPKSDKYAIDISGVPKGYDVQDSYSFSGNTANIVLTSSLITDEDLSTATLGLGDVMYDFTVTTPDGTKITLSKMLKEKKMALINFWYTGCSWCVTEFPFMEEAYQQYKDDVGTTTVCP